MSDQAALALPTEANDRPLRRPKGHNLGSIPEPQREVLDRMVWEGIDWYQAANEANIPLFSMRRTLSKPQVIQYLKEQRQVLRASLSTKNIHRLAQIRDAADNMPAVNAIKLLEELGGEDAKLDPKAITPGITIQINTIAPRSTQANERQPVTIDGETGLNAVEIAPIDADSHDPA